MDRITMVALTVISAYVLIAIVGPMLLPYPADLSRAPPLLPPGPGHPLGTDDLGRDIASCLLSGTRVTLIIGFLGALLGVTIATTGGIASGYAGGWVDNLFCRLLDIFMTIPRVPLLLVLALFFTPGLFLTAVLMGVLSGVHSIRVIRAQVLSLIQAPFIEGVRGLGAGDLHIMRVHILPSLGPLVTMKFVSNTQHFMLMGVGLGFLGLMDPAVIDWGQMLSRATQYGGVSLGLWWWLVPPGIAISILSVALGLLGMGVEESSNPRLVPARL